MHFAIQGILFRSQIKYNFCLRKRLYNVNYKVIEIKDKSTSPNIPVAVIKNIAWAQLEPPIRDNQLSQKDLGLRAIVH